MTVRIGVLGCGGIARMAHLPSLARVPGARVTAVADTDSANFSAASSLAPGVRTSNDLRAVIEADDVDAVIIALPPSLHADTVIDVLRHGKHVYVEKPFGTSVADARRACDAWAGTGLVGMVGFNYRFNPIHQSARVRLAAGAIGTPISVRTVFTTPARSLPQWKQQRANGGGALLDLAVHHIDLVPFLLGAPIADVSADLHSVRTEQDSAFLRCRLTNGVRVETMCSLSAIDEDRIDVYGTSGRLTVDRYGSLRVDVVGATHPGALGGAVGRLAGELSALPYALQRARSPMQDPSFTLAMEAFVRAARDLKPGGPDLSDGLRALAVIEAAEASASSGRVVAIAT